MSSVRNVIDSVSGGKQGAKAARLAAEAQERSGRESIAFQKESRDLARSDLQPFRQAGEGALPDLQALTLDPNRQLEFVQDNPFFQSLKDQAASTLLQNQATKGKLGSGSTAEALQNSLLLLGTDLVNQGIGQRTNLANLGLGAATGQANIAQQTGQSVGGTLEGIGNAQAAGIVGARNAINEGRSQLLSLGAQVAGGAAGGAAGGGAGGGGGAAAGAITSLFTCDRRLKTNIKQIAIADNGLPLYSFTYKQDPTNILHINFMAQDVEKVQPEAVEEIDGIKYLNMEKIKWS